MTDGYQVYHSLEKQKDDLKVAGCWVHAKRKYAELEGTVTAQGVKLISELFHLDGLYDKTKDKDRKDYRQREVASKVDAYFAWVKESLPKVPAGGSTYKALQYSLVETAKANGLRVYKYLEYVLTELAAHQDDTSRDFLADLLPLVQSSPKKVPHCKEKII